MRICIVGPKSCPPEIGGIEVFAYEIGKRLAARGAEVTVVVPRGHGLANEQEIEGIRIVRVRAARNRFALKVSMIPDQIATAVRREPDVLHANDASSGVAALLRLRWRSSVLTVHGTGVSPHEWPPPFRQGAKLLQRLAVVGADAVTTTDEVTASLLRAYREEIRIIPPGVDTSLFSKGLHPKPDVFDNGKVNLLHVGRLAKVKGTDLLVDSVKLLPKEIRDALSLKVIGDGPLAPLVREAARSYPMVEWLGEVPHDRIAPYFAHADMFVMPSRSEGLPISMLEAMSCSVPVVGTVVGGIGTYFDDRHLTKIAAPTAEAVAASIEGAVRDRSGITRKSVEAKALVDARFSWDVIAEQYARLYDETVS